MDIENYEIFSNLRTDRTTRELSLRNPIQYNTTQHNTTQQTSHEKPQFCIIGTFLWIIKYKKT